MSEILGVWPQLIEHTGLSENEAKVYLCLLGLGIGSARKLSMLSNIHRTKIYDIIGRLLEQGLVVEVSGHPKRFVPSSPEVFMPLIRALRRRVRNFRLLFKMLSEAHENAKATASPRQGFVWYLDNCDVILDKCRNLLRGAEREVTIVADGDGVALLFNAVHKVLDNLKEKGVEVRLHSPLDPKRDSLARELSFIFDVRMAEVGSNVFYLDVDHREFLMARMGKSGDSFNEALFSDDPILVRLIYQSQVEGLRRLVILPQSKLDTA